MQSRFKLEISEDYCSIGTRRLKLSGRFSAMEGAEVLKAEESTETEQTASSRSVRLLSSILPEFGTKKSPTEENETKDESTLKAEGSPEPSEAIIREETSIPLIPENELK